MFFVIITIITIIIIISAIIGALFRKTLFLTSEKIRPSCPNGGGGVIWAMPKKTFFFAGGVPLLYV